jgi:hypothetical protein
MNSNAISNLDTPNDPGDAAPRSWINNNDGVIPDTTIPDDQPLADVLNEGNTANQDLDMGGNNIDNVGSRGSSITIGDPTGVHGIQDSDFYGIDVARDTDQAYFGLRNYGDDSDDVVINNEQTSDDIRIQSDGNDRLIVRGGGNIDITSGNLRMNGNEIRFDDGSASISQNADSDVVIQGRDPDQRLELTNNGFLRYKEYHGSNTVFQIRSQGSNDGRVELKGDTELDINGDLIDGVTEIYGSSGNDVTFQNRPRSQDGLYVQSGTAYFNGEVRTDVIQDRGGGNTIRTDSNINLDGNKITNLASPDKPSDVATKNYVDEATSSSGSTTGIKKTWIEDFDADTGTKGTIYGKQPGTTIGKNTQNLFVKTSRSTLSELEFDPFTSKKSEITVRDRQGRGRFGNEYVTFHTETVSKGSLNGVRFTVTATADGSCTTDTRIYDETNDKTIVQTGANSFNPGFESKDYTFSQNSITVTYQQANNYDCGGFRGRDFNTAWYRVPLRSSTVTIDPAYNHKINAWGTVTHYGKQEPGTSALELDVMKDGTVLEDDASPRTAFSGISPDRTPNITIRATRERINDEPSVDLIALTGFL